MQTRLYVVTDGPWSGTGFGEEMRHIAYRLAQSGEYEIIWQSLQHIGYPIDVPDTLFPDLPQKGATIKVVGSGGSLVHEFGSYTFRKHYRIFTPDLVMFMGDPRCIKTWTPLKKKLGFPLAMYVTLDGLPIHPEWLKYLPYVNLLIAMSSWAQIEYMKVGLSLAYIHHGINWNWWSSNEDLKQKLKAKYGIDKNTTVFINRDVNQHRKRHDILLRCWKAFRPESKDAKLILWNAWSHQFGWNFEEKIKQYEVPRETILGPRELVGYPKIWDSPNRPELEHEIAQLGDVYVSTTCFTPKTLVKTNFGVKPIEDVEEKDLLISNNEVNGVEKVNVFDYDGDILEIKPCGRTEMESTPHHKFLVLDRKYKLVNIGGKGGKSNGIYKSFSRDFKRKIRNKDYIIVEKPASELVKGDYLLVPRLNSNYIVNGSDLTDEHLELYGYFISEGCLSRRKRKI